MKRVRPFFSSMAGRLFLILLVGMSVAAVGATLLADARRQAEFERQQMVRTADRLQGFVHLLDANPELRTRLLSAGAGIRQAPDEVRDQGKDAELMSILSQRGGLLADAQVWQVGFGTCRPELRGLLPRPERREGAVDGRPGDGRGGDRRSGNGRRDPDYLPPRCRVVAMTLSDGTPLRVTLETSAVARERGAASHPLFLGLLLLAIAVLAFVVSRIASAPLRGLATAATALGRDLGRAPMPEAGPAEVRSAAAAFNAMQQRIQRHLNERTQMLAAITHDLQTPLTRLRLRLENVEDVALRERLISDLAAMQALIGEGLDLARSSASTEQAVPLELDSLLESLVEDAVEAGADVQFSGGSGQVMSLRPTAMRRVFGNLIDNALKYAGDAHVSAATEGGSVVVRVRDHGPGLPETALESVLDPFVRLEESRSRDTGGAGLGLAIARALLEKDGASLRLSNHPEGGLLAEVRWERADD